MLLAASLAWGAEPSADAPFAEGRSMILPAGEVVPFAGLCLEGTEAKRREWIAQRDAGELARLKESSGSAVVSVPVLVALVAGGLALGVAVGAGLTVAAQQRR